MAKTYFVSIEELAEFASDDFAKRAKEAIAQRGVFNVALSGGNTPKYLFDLLALRPDISWSKVHLFWGDERYVLQKDPQSNYRMTVEHLISKIPIPKANIHPIDTSHEDPKESACAYQDSVPAVFDLIYLGMGPDGHMASLFPGTKLVKDIVAGKIADDQLVASTWVEKFNMYRITFLPSLINAARCVNFLVAGEDKAEALNEVLDGVRDPEMYPAQLIDVLNGELNWLIST